MTGAETREVPHGLQGVNVLACVCVLVQMALAWKSGRGGRVLSPSVVLCPSSFLAWTCIPLQRCAQPIPCCVLQMGAGVTQLLILDGGGEEHLQAAHRSPESPAQQRGVASHTLASWI